MDRQSILSRFMHSLPSDTFDLVFSRNSKTGREAVTYATEFCPDQIIF